MQAVILAAGEGTRMRPLTYTTPKPLAEVAGQTLIERNIAKLPKEVTELIIVVGYMADKIRERIGTEYNGRKVTYVEQLEPLGTAHAVSMCKDYIHERFIVIMSDDFYTAEDFAECVKHDRAILVKRVYGTSSAGKIVCDGNDNLSDILEGTHEDTEGEGILANTNCFVLTPEYFDYPMVKKAAGSSEYGLPQTVMSMIQDYPIKTVEATRWIKVDSMEDLEKLEKELKND